MGTWWPADGPPRRHYKTVARAALRFLDLEAAAHVTRVHL